MKNEILEIENAKLLLKNNGYYVDNLWHINDVKDSPFSNEKYFNHIFNYISSFI